MQALGLVETKGLLAAIECADVMLKSADVTLLEKTKVGGGLVTITVTGDVGAVKAAVEAGAVAVKQLGTSLMISDHVIPRPHEDLEDILVVQKPLLPEPHPDAETFAQAEDKVTGAEVNEDTECILVVEEEAVDETKPAQNVEPHSLNKEQLDAMATESGIEKVLSVLSEQKVTKLRSIAREYQEFGITGRRVSKADKNLLLAEFKAYYETK